MLEILGYIGALFIGIVLGITGGGGSILTVPILVYLLNLNFVIASAYSLFIVGTTSAFGSFQNFKKGSIDVKTAFQFAIPSVLGVYLARKFVVPSIPDPLFYLGSLQLTRGTFLMLIFAVVMLLAAISMLKESKVIIKAEHQNKYWLIIQLFLVGLLIGLIGAGGGFLIIPALMKLAKLPIRKAIGTSLLIITINSLIGFLGDVQTTIIDWKFLLSFTALSVIGIFIGLFIQKYINEKRLKKIFGFFVLTMAVFIIYKEIFS
ncbi:sulfite exporter TauE/SafE family protein [Flavobacterium sp. UBA7682]|uniref:sulfite exporter TauE/SafE family protein n=1 Tax=Flavobacterium sp. UBA7682 TaxID=1946560 RepID=UPI0025B8F2F6|nr:sulfite exporter TauE/SafE family protein [Flavobacterium sp. UBA7682]